jgi:hypothetical protein
MADRMAVWEEVVDALDTATAGVAVLALHSAHGRFSAQAGALADLSKELVMAQILLQTVPESWDEKPPRARGPRLDLSAAAVPATQVDL